MKKSLAIALIAIVAAVPLPTANAFFGGGGLKGPIAVYSKNTAVDSATIANQINTLKQLETALKNIAQLDPSVAAANRLTIQQQLNQLITMQNQINDYVNNYEQLQREWERMTGSKNTQPQDYINQARQMAHTADAFAQHAMQNQAYAQSQAATTGQGLTQLLTASQSAEGALAAAQIGHQIAALQIQQMQLLQATIAAQNQAETAWKQQREQENRAAEEAAAKAFSGKFNPQRGQGPGFGW